MYTIAKKIVVILLPLSIAANAFSQQSLVSADSTPTAQKDSVVIGVKMDSIVAKPKAGSIVTNNYHPRQGQESFFNLSYFNGHAMAKQAVLEWATFRESNKVRFEVERSSDAATFVRIAVVQGRGNDTTAQYYSCIDAFPFARATYYRIRQIDANGRSALSNIITVSQRRWGIFPERELL